MRKILSLILLVAVACSSCDNRDKAIINGQFFGAADKSIKLEQLSPSSSIVVDTTMSNSDGRFSFEIDFSDKTEPTFFNVRYNDQFVPLLIDRDEIIELSAIGNIYYTYTVKGSKGSQLLSDFNKQTVAVSLKLDSLSRMYNMAPTPELGREFSKEYVKLKQQTIRFVMANSNSLVSIVPLYQPIYEDKVLFDEFDPTDMIYYRAIADSLEKYYPSSPYVLSLRNDIKQVDNIYTMDSMVDAVSSQEFSYPEIKIKDAKGEMQSLYALSGKTVLLNFTSSSNVEFKVLNRELADVYDKYKDAGFQIYEVSLDTDKVKWLRSITDNRLPWIQVCDFLGAASPVVAAYNVRALPHSFLIDSKGDIVARNLTVKQLDEHLSKTVK